MVARQGSRVGQTRSYWQGFALKNLLISMCRNNRVILFFLQWQNSMTDVYVFMYDGHVGALVAPRNFGIRPSLETPLRPGAKFAGI